MRVIFLSTVDQTGANIRGNEEGADEQMLGALFLEVRHDAAEGRSAPGLRVA